MNIREEKNNDITICALEGEVNINTSPELRKKFMSIIEANEKKILIDLTNVSYLDSSGLATFIEILQRLKKINGRLRFCNINERVRNILEVTKLVNLFEIFESREEALKGF